jgi:hypothetical protein
MQQTARVKLLTASRLRVWGARTVLSLLDQGVASGVSFVANLLLARRLALAARGRSPEIPKSGLEPVESS